MMVNSRIYSFLLFVILSSIAIAGPAAKLRLTTVQKGCIADGQHRLRFLAEILDSNNQLVTTATNSVTFNLSGTGTFDGPTTTFAVSGRAFINLVSPTTSGSATVTVTSAGLTSASLTRNWIEPRINFSSFPLGVYDDISAWWYNDIRPQIDNMRNHNLDSIMIGNGKVGRIKDETTIQRVNSKNYDLYMGLASTYNEEVGPLNYNYFADSTPTLDDARYVRDLILNDWGVYGCIKAWYTADEPGRHLLDHVEYITQSWQEADFSRPATPVLIGKDRVGPHYNQSDLDVLCIDLYPAGYNNSIGDFTMRHWGYSSDNMVSYFRYVTQDAELGIPIWIVLQTHNFQTQLRQPEPEEVRCMHWISMAEGVKGYFWFIYSTINSQWTGLRYQTDNFNEVSSLAQRLNANSNRLKNILTDSDRVPDACTVSGPTSPSYITPHITTLMKTDGTEFYAVAVNHDCQNSRTLTIDSFYYDFIEDVETQTQYALPAAISFAPGDGKVFELIQQQLSAPSEPSGLTVSERTEKTITIEWQQSTGNPAGYRVYNAADDQLLDDTADTFCKIDGLLPGLEHCFYVIAYNNAGDSDPSAEICAWTYSFELPTPPDDVRVSELGAEQIQIQWDPAQDNVAVQDYDVYIDGSYDGSTTTTTYSFLCESNTRYDISVLARDVDGGLSELTPEICAVSCDALSPIELLGYWKFDENGGTIAQDSSNYANDATLNNGPVWTNGYYGWALDFDSSDDYVDAGIIEPVGNELTLSAWVYPHSFALFSNDNRIISKATGSAEDDHYWMLSTVSNNGDVRLRFRLKTNGNTLTLKGQSEAVNTNQWSHVAAVYDGSAMKVYVNGVEDSATMSKSGNIDNGTSINVLIGSNPNSYSPWDGMIDDVRIYEKALTLTQIQELMQGTEPLPAGAGDCSCDIISDFDCSCQVDFSDLVYISSSWACDTFPALGDIVEDDIVNIDDLTYFASQWLLQE